MGLKILAKCEECGKENVETYATRWKYCRDCVIKMEKSSRFLFKDLAVKYKGGQCQICGYADFTQCLDFHHLDPKQKDFSFSSIRVSTDKPEIPEIVKEELDKCILLCCRCHREVHAIEESGKQSYAPQKEKYADSKKPLECVQCHKVFVPKTKQISKYCSAACAALSHVKVQARPPKEKLQELIDSLPMTTIGKMFGVSDNAVRKWCKKYGIEKSPDAKVTRYISKSVFALKEDGTKICKKCMRVLMEQDFGFDSGNADGLESWCRGCNTKRKRELYAEK